jgi:hypothetical protein
MTIIKESRFGNWLPLILAATSAVDGWLILGPVAQSTLIAAAVIRRLRTHNARGAA